MVRLVTETVGITEVILRHVPRIINETVGISEPILRARKLVRLLQEAISISGVRDPFIFVERILSLTSKVISNMALTSKTLTTFSKISKIIKNLYFNSKI